MSVKITINNQPVSVEQGTDGKFIAVSRAEALGLDELLGKVETLQK